MADNAQKVRDIIEKELGVEREKLTDEASFIEDLGADSLDIVELVMEFEKEFNIDIPDEDAEKLRTVGDAIGYSEHEDAATQRVKRRVVVTGMGAITPVGNDVATTWRAITAGVSGGAPITKFDRIDLSGALRLRGERLRSARVHGAQGSQARRPVRAVRHRRLGAGDDRRRASTIRRATTPSALGVIIGSGIGGLKTFEEQHDVYRERGASKISAFFIPMFISDIAAGLVSMRFNAQGPELRDDLGMRDERARDRRRVSHDPVRRRRRHHHRRLRGDRHADGDRRLREHEGAVRAQRIAGNGVPSVRRDARRLRDGRRRRESSSSRSCEHALERGAHDLRRDRRLRRDWRRVSPHRAGAGRRGRAARDAPRDGRRQAARRPTSTTSTRTARRRRPTISTRRRRSRRSSATRVEESTSARPSR